MASDSTGQCSVNLLTTFAGTGREKAISVTFLKQNRLILTIFAVTVILAGLEVSGRTLQTDETITDRVALSPDSDLVVQLYPDSPEADHIRGMQAWHLRFDLKEARKHFERGLESGIKAHSQLHYDYAAALHLMQAPEEEVDAAIERWLTNDPASGQLHPKKLHRPFPEWNKPGSLKVMALCDDGRHFAIAKDDGIVSWIDLPAGEGGEIVLSGVHRPDHLLEFSSDAKLLLAADSEGIAAILNVEDNSLMHLLEGQEQVVTSGAFSRDGLKCAIGRIDGDVRLWNSDNGKTIGGYHPHDYPVSAIAFDHAGRMLVTGDRHGIIRLCGAESGSIGSLLIAECNAAISDFAWAPNDKFVAAAARDNMVRVYDTDTTECVMTLVGHTAPVASVAYSPLGRFIATGSTDRTVRFWDAKTGEEISRRKIGATDGVCSVTFSPFGDMLIAADYNGSVHPVPVPLR